MLCLAAGPASAGAAPAAAPATTAARVASAARRETVVSAGRGFPDDMHTAERAAGCARVVGREGATKAEGLFQETGACTHRSITEPSGRNKRKQTSWSATMRETQKNRQRRATRQEDGEGGT